MKHQLIEKHNDLIQVSDFETYEELLAHKEKRMEANPEAVFEEKDNTAEVEAEKARKEKKKNFKFKGKTIAELREEMNEWVEMQK